MIQSIRCSKIQWEYRVQRKRTKGWRTSKKIVFQAKRREKEECNVDTSSDPHDRRAKNDYRRNDRLALKMPCAEIRKIIKFSVIFLPFSFLFFLFFFLFFFFGRSRGKTCFHAPVDSRNIFARLTKALSQRLLVSPTKNRHFSPTYFPRSPSPSSVASLSRLIGTFSESPGTGQWRPTSVALDSKNLRVCWLFWCYESFCRCAKPALESPDCKAS